MSSVSHLPSLAPAALSPNLRVPSPPPRRNDLYGARDSGCFAWLWGQDVCSFADVEQRLETGNVW